MAARQTAARKFVTDRSVPGSYAAECLAVRTCARWRCDRGRGTARSSSSSVGWLSAECSARGRQILRPRLRPQRVNNLRPVRKYCRRRSHHRPRHLAYRSFIRLALQPPPAAHPSCSDGTCPNASLHKTCEAALFHIVRLTHPRLSYAWRRESHAPPDGTQCQADGTQCRNGGVPRP